MKTIIIHVSPDFDAIAFAWLARKYAPGFQGATVEFMPLNQIDRYRLDEADAVGDMGGEFDPERWRFDHHHLPGREATSTCAAKQLWGHLLSLGCDVTHLEPLIEEIYQGDIGKTALVGIHSQLFGWKSRAKENGDTLTDYDILEFGCQILDDIDFWLRRKSEARAELEEKVVWKSKDGLVWAIQGGSTSTSFAAYDEGAIVTVFEGEPIELDGDGGTTYPVGATRSPEWQSPHLGELVGYILNMDQDAPLRDELSKWYRHQAGFFVGRGGGKAPDSNPLQIDIVRVAKALNETWKEVEQGG